MLREMTQEELADRAGLSSRYLGSIERGAVSASVTVLGRLAQALRVSPCDLIAPPQRSEVVAFQISRQGLVEVRFGALNGL